MPTNSSKRDGCALAIMAPLALIVAVLAFRSACSSDKPASADQPTPEKVAEDERKADEASIEARMASQRASAPEPAKTCSISIANYPGKVLVFPTEDGYEEFGKASATKDRQTIDLASISNGAYWVDKGTKCLWRDRGLLTSKVRVVEGPHAGKIAWLDREWSEGRE